jgi:hypothetical protein
LDHQYATLPAKFEFPGATTETEPCQSGDQRKKGINNSGILVPIHNAERNGHEICSLEEKITNPCPKFWVRLRPWTDPHRIREWTRLTDCESLRYTSTAMDGSSHQSTTISTSVARYQRTKKETATSTSQRKKTHARFPTFLVRSNSEMANERTNQSTAEASETLNSFAHLELLFLVFLLQRGPRRRRNKYPKKRNCQKRPLEVPVITACQSPIRRRSNGRG